MYLCTVVPRNARVWLQRSLSLLLAYAVTKCIQQVIVRLKTRLVSHCCDMMRERCFLLQRTDEAVPSKRLKRLKRQHELYEQVAACPSVILSAILGNEKHNASL